jgi:hypothetical protein
VWGPAVYKAEENPGATNAMFVAYSASESCYVVAIAGTNPLGDSALLFEDLDVKPADMVAWPPTISNGTLRWTPSASPNASVAAIDKGTSLGLAALFALTGPGLDPTTSKVTQNVTLQSYLQSVTSSSSTLIFTGHSLGGALAPTLALMLYPTPATSGWSAVRILATAGPTPGTRGVADLFAANYAAVAIAAYTLHNQAFASFTFWNQNYCNVFDVVPRAWDKLAGLVIRPPRPDADFWPSFFARGGELQPELGQKVFNMVGDMQNRSGYRQGINAAPPATPFYAPAMRHNPFTGIFGTWSTGDDYPKNWTATLPPKQVFLMPDLAHWILDAHLDQYPHAFLGQTAPKFPAHQ